MKSVYVALGLILRGMCIAHMIRNSTKFVSYKDIKKVYADLKAVYTAGTEEVAHNTLEEFGKSWDKKYPMIHQSWERHWDDLSEFFNYPPEIRKAIYTTNAIDNTFQAVYQTLPLVL
jgi:transposase-like protein